MRVVSVTEERTIRTPGGEVFALAGPSQGSAELSTWRVRMEQANEGPVHEIDREQVWMPITGAFAITIDGQVTTVGAGQAAILPAGVTRQVRVAQGPAEALVCMPVGGTASTPDTPQRRELPWAH
ncbi:hypothetical protein GCM10023322_82070 [Rugosimonospora acidiphila]|uniref:Cupin type-2 domain-containing protein n=1 Tax=Rugosimonospora acidiphila TaxID=556531 RepID=A0ABP9SV35_9ACTN